MLTVVMPSMLFSQLYRFGETVSIPFFDDCWKPTSFYKKIRSNRENNLHTLCLLGKGVVIPSMLTD